MSNPRFRSMLLASIGVILGWACWRGLAAAIPVDPAWTDRPARLAAAIASLLPSAGMLLAMVTAQMIARFASGIFDPTQGRDGRFLRINQRVITNTVEQMSIFAPGLVAFAAGTDAGGMQAVIALAWTFAAARLVFWLGYLKAPMLRAPGMAASFVLNAGALIAAISVWTR